MASGEERGTITLQRRKKVLLKRLSLISTININIFTKEIMTGWRENPKRKVPNVLCP
jgi:hypothetical protein